MKAKLREGDSPFYDHLQKERVLRTVLEVHPNEAILRREVGAIACGATSPDYFQYIRPGLLVDIASRYREMLVGSMADMSSATIGSKLRHEVFSRFFDMFSSVTTVEDERIVSIMKPYRKILSLAQGAEELRKACDMIVQADEMGVLEQEDVMVYTGTFNPFPHRGHIEVARTAIMHAYGQGIENPRLVISTFGVNHWKPETSKTFSARLQQLHNGFFYDNQAGAVGICGDTSKGRSFEQQSLLVATSGAEAMRYVVGSDIFITDAEMAREGHPFALPFFMNNVEFYISHRPQDDRDLLEEARNIAVDFGRKTHILLQPKYDLSGTKIRALEGGDILNQAPNHLVKEYALWCGASGIN